MNNLITQNIIEDFNMTFDFVKELSLKNAKE